MSFPYGGVVKVQLDSCYGVRARLSKAFDKAAEKVTSTLDARPALTVERWFAHSDGMLVTCGASSRPEACSVTTSLDEGNPVSGGNWRGADPRIEAVVTRRVRPCVSDP